MEREYTGKYSSIARWEGTHKERVQIVLPKGKRALINAAAAQRGKSTNEYIIELIEQDTGLDLHGKEETATPADHPEG